METEHQILHSGVFKLDIEGKPIGIKEEAIGGEPSRYDPRKLEKMISDIADLITTYKRPVSPPDNVLKDVLDDYMIDFDKDLEAVLDKWGLSLNDLKSCHDQLIKKAKKYIKNKKDIPYKGELKSLLYFEKAGTRDKGIGRRTYMVDRIHKIFKDYNIKQTITDINYHTADILIACGDKTTSRDKLFYSIDRAYYK